MMSLTLAESLLMEMDATLPLLRKAQKAACGCTDDQPWCHLCSRPTCHWGEHSDEQLLAFIGEEPR